MKALEPSNKTNIFSDLRGKTALITGASSQGVGRQLAYLLSQFGVKVITSSRREERLIEITAEIIKNGGTASYVIMDMADKSSIDQAFNTTLAEEKIDILVNTGAVWLQSSLLDIDSSANFEESIKVNLTGTYYLTQAVVQKMIYHKIHGSIIVFGSVSGRSCPGIGSGAIGYAMSKAAVMQFTEAVATQLAPHNIRINTIEPGAIYTEVLFDYFKDKEAADDFAKNVPLGFMAQATDFDGAVLYLASNNASRYVTGSTIRVDGGLATKHAF